MIIENSNEEKEKVIIVGTDLGARPYSLDTSMNELAELVDAAGAEVVGQVVQNVDKINPRFLIGSGKVIEIKEFCEKLEVDTVVFNDELTGIQIRNLEDEIDRKIVDRTSLILDIFALRAKTKEGMLQVKLAQLNYRSTRLIGSKNLSRTGGGIGTRGPGEQKLEIDRRHIQREITSIKKSLKYIEKTRDTMRKNRANNSIPLVSLVGYTNAGKSTLLNRLISLTEDNSDKEVFVKDMLFATLDPAMRKAKFKSGSEIILSDTVGFVSKLPTKLVEAFKSTLEEIKYADLILHVIDASEEDIEIQYKTTMNILKDMDILDKPIITVFNKWDKVNKEEFLFDYGKDGSAIFISAKSGENIDKLVELIEKGLNIERVKVKLLIAYDNSNDLNQIMKKYEVTEVEYVNEGTQLTVELEKSDYERYKKYIR